VGHPALKKMGARQGYSLLNGLAFLPFCFFGISGLLVSVIATVSINPILVFIGVVICVDTLSITPKRHYPAFLIGLMPVIADWANGTIANGVASAYSKSNMTFSQAQSSITGFNYQGLVNFSGGALLQCIFLTAIMMYIIDRKFIYACVWSLLAGLFAFFGLINASGVGVLYRKDDYGWKFTTGYTMLAVLFLGFEFCQRRQWIEQPVSEPDDLSSLEWAEWNRQQQQQTNNTNQDEELKTKFQTFF
ncbi:unnamed protein product, partial [Didymodactylos carnosus]